MDGLNLTGEFHVRHLRNGICLAEHYLKNAVTDTAKNDLLNEYLGNGGASSGLWYIGLISNLGYSSTNASDTLASHPGWLELANYSGSRQRWYSGTAGGKAIDSSANVVFSFLSSGSVRGFLVASVASGSGGILWSTVTLGSGVAVVADDKYVITSYRVTIA